MKYAMGLLIVVALTLIAIFGAAESARGGMNCNAWLESNLKPEEVAQIGMDGPILIVELKDSSAILLIPDVPEIQLTEEGKAKLKHLGKCTVEGKEANIFKAPPQKTLKDELERGGKIPNEKT